MDAGLRIRRHPKARRIKLRLDPATGEAVVTLPPGVAEREGLRFANQHRDWLAARRAEVPTAVGYAPGSIIPLFGEDHEIRHQPDLIGIHHDPAALQIVAGGPAENFGKRLEGWLKARARRHLSARLDHFTARAGKSVKRLRIGDPRSRWGSCSATGTLSLSWRLIMAPEFVSDYVVAHEVAHLVELNHSDRFWRVVEDLVGDPADAREWLRAHGPALHRIGDHSP